MLRDGLVSRHHTAQILPQMCHASRASRSGLAVDVLRVLCSGLCTPQRFHMEGEDKDPELDVRINQILSHTTMNVLSFKKLLHHGLEARCVSTTEEPSAP